MKEPVIPCHLRTGDVISASNTRELVISKYLVVEVSDIVVSSRFVNEPALKVKVFVIDVENARSISSGATLDWLFFKASRRHEERLQGFAYVVKS